MSYASLSHPIDAFYYQAFVSRLQGMHPDINPLFCCVISSMFNGSVRYYIKHIKNFNEFEILGNPKGYDTLDKAKTFLVEIFKERAELVGISTAYIERFNNERAGLLSLSFSLNKKKLNQHHKE